MKNGLWILLALALAACGGANTGSDGTGVAPPPTEPAVASGPLTSLGPLGLAGATLNDTSTQVLLNATAARSASDLRLGMFAEAEALVARSADTGIATTSVAQSVVLGPVTGMDATRGSVQVLGQPVRVDTNTLLEGFERLDAIAPGDYVEVFGLRLPGEEGTLATRLIARGVPQDRSVEVLGGVSDFSAGPPLVFAPGVRVELASAQVGIASPAGVQIQPPGISSLMAGAKVRVRGTYDPASGTVTATSVTTGFEAARPEGRLVYLEGFVTARVSTHYRVGDASVDTTTLGRPLTVGTRVRLRGVMASGSVRVDQLTEIAPGERIEYTVEGPISSFASIADFTLRGERIDASRAVFAGGPPSSLGQGRRLRVKGVAGPGKVDAVEVTLLPN